MNLKADSKVCLVGIACISILFICTQACLAQAVKIRGILVNELTSEPVSQANISIYGTDKGTSTDKSGRFTLEVAKLPVSVAVSCIGYEKARFRIEEYSGKPLELSIKPVVYNLREVEVSSVRHAILFQDRSYSVLDYELMDDNILLLVFRTSLKRSELVLLSRTGDTLAVQDPPMLPPQKLYRDFLSNVHYYSKDNYTWQCYYDKEKKAIGFLDPQPADTLEKHMKPFLFRIANRLYFEDKIAGGFGIVFGYYSRNKGKCVIKTCINEKKITEYADDQKFYLGWNALSVAPNTMDTGQIGSPSEFDFSISSFEGGAYGKNEVRAHRFEFYNLIFPLIRISDDSLAFFNFGSDIIEILDRDGTATRTLPVSFHKEVSVKSDADGSGRLETSGWRWGTRMFTDPASSAVYTMFIKNGMVKIKKIDLSTGKLNAGTIIPFPFPEKIIIYQGEAYFLFKESGYRENWKLAKCRLD